MRPFLVLLLVVAAAVTFYLAMNPGGKKSDEDSALTPDAPPAEATTQDPPGVAALADIDPGRAVADPNPSGNPSERDVAHPGGRRGNAIKGRVVLANQEPVEDADVTLTRYGPLDFLSMPAEGQERVADRAVTSNKEGLFSFRDVEPDTTYTLVAYHGQHGRCTETHVSVADGEIGDEVLMILSAGARFYGAVTDTASNVVPGAQVRLSTMGLAALDVDRAGTFTETDAAGNYEFHNVVAGNYALTVEAEGYGRTLIQQLNISGSEDIERNVVLQVAYMIGGVVTSSEGLAIEGAKVQAYQRANQKESTNSQTLTDENGDFLLDDVRAGSYTLVVQARGYEPWREPRVESGEMGLAFELVRLPTVTGQVLDPSGKPLPNFTVQLRQFVANTDQTVSVPRTRQVIKNSEDGAFEVACPRENDYVVEAMAAPYAACQSERFHIAKGQKLTGIVVRMNAGGTIKGRVIASDGSPVGGARVKTHHTDFVDDPFWNSLGDAYPSAATKTEVRTKADGTFVIEELTPETYQVDVRHSDYANLVVRGIVVTENSTAETGDIRLSVGAKVSGTVYGPDGQGLAGALIQLTLNAQESGDIYGSHDQVRTNAEGRYIFNHIPAGPYEIFVQRQGGGSNPFEGLSDSTQTRRSITLVEGQEYVEDFSFSN